MARGGFLACLLAVVVSQPAVAADPDDRLEFGAPQIVRLIAPAQQVWPLHATPRERVGLRESTTRLPPLPDPWQAFALQQPWALAVTGTAVGPPQATWQGWIPSLLLLGAFAGVQFGVDPPEDPRWSSRNSFDDGARDAFKGGDRSTRDDASLASDILFGGMAGMLVGDWWWLRNEYGLLRSVQVDTRWWLANNLVTRVAKVSAGRERPYVRPCEADDDYIGSCGGGRDRNGGFFSGHASNTATIAGLLCARHLHRRSVGVGDMLVCGGAVAGAITTGVLRMTAEKHFMTDVLAGWVVGLVFGYVLPSHFDYGGADGGPLSLTAVTPVIGREYYGVRYGFRF
jgi:membrane-associated phospholipid phosphatase